MSELFIKGRPARAMKGTKVYSSTGMFAAETRCFGWGKKLLLGAAGLAGGALLNNAMGDPLGINPYLAKAGSTVGGWLGNLGIRPNAGVVANTVAKGAGQMNTAAQVAHKPVVIKDGKLVSDPKDAPEIVHMPDWSETQGTYTPSYGNSSVKQWWNGLFYNNPDTNDQYAMLDALEAQIKQNPNTDATMKIDQQLKGIALNAKTPQTKQRAERLYNQLHGRPVDEKLEYNSAPPTSLQQIKAEDDDYKRYTEMLAEESKLKSLAAKFQSSPYVNTPEGDAVFTEAKSIVDKINASPFDDIKRTAASTWALIDALSKKYDGQAPQTATQAQSTTPQTTMDDPTPQMEKGIKDAIAKKDGAELSRIMTWMLNSRAIHPLGHPITDKINQLIAYARVEGGNLMPQTQQSNG